MRLAISAILLVAAAPLLHCPGGTSLKASDWTVYIANSACSDYTWGWNEEQTRRAFADVVKAHLDQMNRTDNQPSANRDRYNLSITQEAVMFLEFYPERKAEFIRRIREGRISIGAFLNNNLWGFQSVESEIRSLYSARRMEEEWETPVRVAQHIEEPAMPWGAASILAGSGFRWLMVPFLDYDSNFGKLTNPPLFTWAGPDGATIRVVMDNWASEKANYVQGRYILANSSRIEREWLPHYAALGANYPIRIIAALGTHGDNNPAAGTEAPKFADAIAAYNARTGDHARLVNSTLPQIAGKLDELEAARHFLPALSGDFGISWDAWPVTLAKYAAAMRSGERSFLAAETLLARAARRMPDLRVKTRQEHARAEWDLTMLADHAWNGDGPANRTVNVNLRRRWSEELDHLSNSLQDQAWQAAGLTHNSETLALFNSLSFARADLVRAEISDPNGFAAGLASQVVMEDSHPILYFVSPAVPAFQFLTVQLKSGQTHPQRVPAMRATEYELESPLYRLRVDPQTGGIASLFDQRAQREIVASSGKASLGQTVFFNGQAHPLQNVHSEVVTVGPVLARLKVVGTTEGIQVTNQITLYAALDRIDLDIRIHKPVTTNSQRVVQIFPIQTSREQRIETTGAVIRPELQPAGDLAPGADPNRFAVQNFIDISDPGGPGVTIAPLDAFLLRRDLGAVTFEALGNDQNYKESTRDQAGETDFRFRYAIQPHAATYDAAQAFTWSRSIATPLLANLGSLPREVLAQPTIAFDPRRAVATAFKLADKQGDLLRIWETSGRSGPLTISVPGYRQAVRTDLIERDLQSIPIKQGKINISLDAKGFAALRLLR